MHSLILKFLGWRRLRWSEKPTLQTVSPISYWTCWAFVFLNIHLGLYFSTHPSEINRVVATWILSFGLWGVVFFAVAIVLAYALLTNRWATLLITMLIGFSLKLLWAVALIFMIPELGYPRLSGSIGMWLSFAAIQAIVVIYLYPREVAVKNVERSLNQ